MGHEALPGHTCNLPSFPVYNGAGVTLRMWLRRLLWRLMAG